MARRLLLTIGWAVALAVMIRHWEIGSRFPGLTLWSVLFLAAYALSLVAARGVAALRDRSERSRAFAWIALMVAALVGQALLPTVTIRGVIVHTVAFVKVTDTVVPLWILGRALLV